MSVGEDKAVILPDELLEGADTTDEVELIERADGLLLRRPTELEPIQTPGGVDE